MDKPDSQENTWDFAKLIADYADALTIFQSDSDVKLSSREVLRVLRSRDRIYEALSDRPTISDEFLEKLVALDIELTQQANVICRVEHFERFRENLQPSESAWWWYLEPIAQKSRFEIFFDQYDWVWNLGTFFCLVLATSFATQTAKAFSEDGFDLLGTFSTLGQGAGLAFVASGALTGGGRQYVSRILISVKISGSLHAVVTFGVALILLASSFAFNKNLNLVGHWYFDQAQQREKRGEWSQAFKDYKRALNFSPDDYVTQIASGFLHEKLGNFDQAIEIYKKGSAFGIPEFWNAQARAMLMSAWQKNNWQGEIDQKVLSEIENLLQRAGAAVEQAKEQIGDVFKMDERLFSDISINRAIVTFAKIKLGKELSEQNEWALGAYPYTNNTRQEFTKVSKLTEVSTLGEPRSECFVALQSDFDRIIDPWATVGIDFSVQKDQRAYNCKTLLSFATIPDVLWLKNFFYQRLIKIEDSHSLIQQRNAENSFYQAFNQAQHFRFEFKYNLKVIQESQVWLNLASKLGQMIDNDLTQIKLPEDGGYFLGNFRILISKDGQIIGFIENIGSYRYRSFIKDLQFIKEAFKKESIQQLLFKLKDRSEFEFADFKVTLSSDRKKVSQIVPWASAYAGANEFCKTDQWCKKLYISPTIRDAFPSYVVPYNNRNYIDTSSGLPSVLSQHIYLMSTSSSIIKYSDDKPSIFKLTVSADGQIIDRQFKDEMQRGLMKQRILRKGCDSQEIFSVCD